MWDAFRRDAESVPEINAEVAKLPAWGGPYALRPSEVLEHNVRSVADICVEYARKYHVENEDSRYCEQMLQTDSGNAP